MKPSVDRNDTLSRRISRTVWVLLVIGVVHGGFFTLLHNDVCNDVAQYYSAAKMLHQGDVLYRDIIDTNPPPIFYLNLIPLFVSDTTGLDAVRAINISCYVALLLVFICALQLFRAANPTVLPVVQAIFLLVWLHVGFMVLDAHQFAQRDPMIAVLLLPYLMLVYARWRGQNVPALLSGAAAMFMVLAVTMKPHYILMPLALETYYRWREASRRYYWRMEHSIAVVGILLLVMLIVLIPGFRSYYIDWMPLLQKYYSAYGGGVIQSISTLFSEALARAFLIGALLAGIVLFRSPAMEDRQLAQLLSLSLLLFLLIYLLQGKGWIYQRIPIWYASATMIAFATGVILHRGTERIRWQHLLVPMILVLMQLAMVPRLHAYFIRGLPPQAESSLAHYFKTHSMPGDRIAVISMVVAPGSEALLYADRLPAIRYLSAFPLPLAYTGTSSHQLTGERKRMADGYYVSLLADLRTFRPPIVAIDTLWYFRNTPDGFTMKKWLQQRDFYRTLESNYRRVAPVMNFEMYERRKNAPRARAVD
ncbi:MAG: hypothetical protein IH600_12750 [Bacteroidetes bacterium]|nr:hypothetical protein [Bacteroidota bacterium]